MKYISILFSFMLLLFSFCNQNQRDVTVYRLKHVVEKSDSTLYIFSKYDSSNYKLYHYRNSSNKGFQKSIELKIDTSKPSTVLFNLDTFQYRGSSRYYINHKNIYVKSYLGAFKGADTGLALYLTYNEGLIIVQSIGWLTNFTFIYDSNSIEIINLLLADSSGFVLTKNFEDKFFQYKDQ